MKKIPELMMALLMLLQKVSSSADIVSQFWLMKTMLFWLVTRFKALQKLGWETAEVVIRDGLTDEQKQKYRLLDNKTNEIASWDFDLLNEELEGLDFEGFDFGFDLASTSEEFLDSFFTPVKDETTATNNTGNKPSGDYSFEPEKKKIQCPHCGEWFEV